MVSGKKEGIGLEPERAVSSREPTVIEQLERIGLVAWKTDLKPTILGETANWNETALNPLRIVEIDASSTIR